MRVLVISDIHANLTALEAVLDNASTHLPAETTFDSVWCLGDLVGYGPDPNECVQRVRDLAGLVCLIGNHDQAALGQIPLSRFNREARQVAEWTRHELKKTHREYLASLPSQAVIGAFTLAHGSPRQPVWEYILDNYTADVNFDVLSTDYCLVGHSHLPLVFERDGDGPCLLHLLMTWDQPLSLRPKMILNPGSVGQPRDMDARASYAILDTEAVSWQLHRVPYDVPAVQARILQAGLPERQATRLLAGW
jgi:diadenosine tetraphosphatase ApaH/serine/threonine PP2A family protein phosphatase